MTSYRHIALYVQDLRAAEGYYQHLFNMHLIGREAELDDGLWYTLPDDKDWDDAKAAGLELGMLALRKEDFVLVLFAGISPPGQVYAIGLYMTEAEIAEVRNRLTGKEIVLDDNARGLAIRDPYQIIWQLVIPGNPFRTAGDFANRWLPV